MAIRGDEEHTFCLESRLPDAISRAGLQVELASQHLLIELHGLTGSALKVDKGTQLDRAHARNSPRRVWRYDGSRRGNVTDVSCHIGLIPSVSALTEHHEGM
jgi:uncharacterized SAM-dependent methyltransferase